MQNVSKKIQPYGNGARQTFLQFFRQNTWFLENNGTMSKFLFGIMNYLISINRLLKNQFLKRNLYKPHKPP